MVVVVVEADVGCKDCNCCCCCCCCCCGGDGGDEVGLVRLVILGKTLNTSKHNDNRRVSSASAKEANKCFANGPYNNVHSWLLRSSPEGWEEA